MYSDILLGITEAIKREFAVNEKDNLIKLLMFNRFVRFYFYQMFPGIKCVLTH